MKVNGFWAAVGALLLVVLVATLTKPGAATAGVANAVSGGLANVLNVAEGNGIGNAAAG